MYYVRTIWSKRSGSSRTNITEENYVVGISLLLPNSCVYTSDILIFLKKFLAFSQVVYSCTAEGEVGPRDDVGSIFC